MTDWQSQFTAQELKEIECCQLTQLYTDRQPSTGVQAWRIIAKLANELEQSIQMHVGDKDDAPVGALMLIDGVACFQVARGRWKRVKTG